MIEYLPVIAAMLVLIAVVLLGMSAAMVVWVVNEYGWVAFLSGLCWPVPVMLVGMVALLVYGAVEGQDQGREDK